MSTICALLALLLAVAAACDCDAPMPVPGTEGGEICGGCPAGTYCLGLWPAGSCGLRVSYDFSAPVVLHIMQQERVVRSCGSAHYCYAEYTGLDPRFPVQIEWTAQKGVLAVPAWAPVIEAEPCPAVLPSVREGRLPGAPLCPGEGAHSITIPWGHQVCLIAELDGPAEMTVTQPGVTIFTLLGHRAQVIVPSVSRAPVTLEIRAPADGGCVNVTRVYFFAAVNIDGDAEPPGSPPLPPPAALTAAEIAVVLIPVISGVVVAIAAIWAGWYRAGLRPPATYEPLADQSKQRPPA